MDFSSASQLFHPRYHNMKRLLETFPQRTFVLLGDTSSGSTAAAYTRIAREHPDQVRCILMRDTAKTERGDWHVADTRDFADLRSDQYFFYTGARDLRELEFRENMTGCWEGGRRQSQSLQVVRRGWFRTRVLELSTAVWWRVQCDFLRPRVNAKCHFDWHQGELW